MTNPDPLQRCPACGRRDYVPGLLLAALLLAVSPMLGALLATLLGWWWLVGVTLTGWILALLIAVNGVAAAARAIWR